MRVLSVPQINIYNNRTYSIKPSFTAHPDFLRYSTASCYFRRGAVLLTCAKGYEEIENLFHKIFKLNPNVPKSMLIAGIGNSQEPFSYLASIKGIIKNNALEKNLDLYTVDLQSKPEHIKLKKDAFCDLLDYQSFPKYAENSFVKDSTKDWLEIKQAKRVVNQPDEYLYKISSNYDRWKELRQQGYSSDTILKRIEAEEKQKSMRWRVNDEIFEFLEKTYNNPQKSKWESRMQDVIKTYPDEKFDIISANNSITYILSNAEIKQTVRNMLRTLKKGGYIITDPYDNVYHVEEISKYKNVKKINDGIYQKTE